MGKSNIDITTLFWSAAIAARGNPVMTMHLVRSALVSVASSDQDYQRFSGAYSGGRGNSGSLLDLRKK